MQFDGRCSRGYQNKMTEVFTQVNTQRFTGEHAAVHIVAP